MKTDPLKQIYNYFLFGGFLLVLFGVLHLYTFSQTSNSIKLYDGLFNLIYGLMFLASSIFLKSKNVLVIYLVIFTTSLSLIYSFVMNRGLNLVTLGYSSFLLYWLIQLKIKKVLK